MSDSERGVPGGEEKPLPERKWRFRRFFGIRIFILLVVVALAGVLGGTYHYSTSPQFCRSCHIMEPYYQAWETSSHNFVSCVECHYPPEILDTMWVKFQALSQLTSYITRTYGSKPVAEVEDASCLRSGCHATQYLVGDLLYKGFVKFNHREHLNSRRAGKKLRCTSCHSQIVVGTHMAVTNSTCFQCHFNKGVRDARHLEPLGGCNNCHTSPSRNIKIANITYNHVDYVGKKDVPCQNCHIDTIQGTGEAPRDRCFDCHNKPEHLKRYGDIEWLHDQHVSEKNIECQRCHKPIEHGLPRNGSNHMGQLNCTACHQTEHQFHQEILFGTGGVGVPDIPSPMLLARVQCVACHVKPHRIRGGAVLFEAIEDACLKCHTEKYRGMIGEWKETIQKALAEIEPKVKAAGEVLDKTEESRKRAAAKKLYDDAQHNLMLVKEGNPIHNIYYTARLLQAANERIDAMGATLSFSPKDLGRNSLISGTFCNTLCHNRVGVKLPERVTWNDIRVPHIRHAGDMKIGCANCHAFGQHKQVSVKIKREECLSCHHQALKMMPKIPCQGCHRNQVAFRKGQSLGEGKGVKGAMTTLPCKSCHAKIAGGHQEAEVRESCNTCHNPAYANFIDSWKKDVSAKRQSVQDHLSTVEVLMEDASPATRKQLTFAVDSARKILETIAFDQSGGFHNYSYAVDLIRRADKILKDADKSIPNG